MRRVLSTAVLLGLLICTAAAFAVTERLKLVKSPVYGAFVSKTLSPVCGCARGKAVVSFKLRRGDDVTLTILDRRRDVVATLADATLPRGRSRFVWRGRTDEGVRAPDGIYQPQIHLARSHRTILMPNRIRLDTHPPKVLAVESSRHTISPDGDHVGDSIKLGYRLSEPARIAVYLGENRLIFGRFRKPKDSVNWLGKGVDGRPLKAGTYLLHVGAVDTAGNVTPVAQRKPLLIRVRYLTVLPAKMGVRTGAQVAARVDTDAHRYWWKLGGRHGVATKPILRVKAPLKPGSYVLLVGEGHYTAKARVFVVGR